METVDIDTIITAGGAKQVKSIPILTDSLSVTTYFLEPGKRIPAHVHNRFDEINYIVKGNGYITIENERHDVRSGMLVLVPRTKSHYFSANTDELVVLSFNQINGTDEMHGP